jgi:hypothetical protein
VSGCAIYVIVLSSQVFMLLIGYIIGRMSDA